MQNAYIDIFHAAFLELEQTNHPSIRQVVCVCHAPYYHL